MSNSTPKQELKTALTTILETTPLIEEHEAQSGRTQTITFKVSQAEKEQLKHRCSGLIQSDYIRARLFDYHVPYAQSVMPQVNRETIYHLKRIGANLNQQTKAIHTAIKQGRQPLTKGVSEYLLTLNQLQENINLLRAEIIDTFSD